MPGLVLDSGDKDMTKVKFSMVERQPFVEKADQSCRSYGSREFGKGLGERWLGVVAQRRVATGTSYLEQRSWSSMVPSGNCQWFHLVHAPLWESGEGRKVGKDLVFILLHSVPHTVFAGY